MSGFQMGNVLSRVSVRTWVFVGIALAVVVFDQVTKWYAVAHLTHAFDAVGSSELDFFEKLSAFLWDPHPVRAEPVTVLEDFWHFRYVENPGSAWGFLAGAASWFRTPFFLMVSLAAMVFIVVYFRRTEADQKWLRVALALVFGGAIGNFIDRARFGYVIDFIDWHWFDEATWPTFNIADSAISVGVAIMVLEMLLKRPAKATESSSGAARARSR